MPIEENRDRSETLRKNAATMERQQPVLPPDADILSGSGEADTSASQSARVQPAPLAFPDAGAASQPVLDAYGIERQNHDVQESRYRAVVAAYQKGRSPGQPNWDELASAERHAFMMTAEAARASKRRSGSKQ